MEVSEYLTLQAKQQQDGRWFTRAVDELDSHGNEIDACQDTLRKSVNCVLDQILERGQHFKLAGDF